MKSTIVVLFLTVKGQFQDGNKLIKARCTLREANVVRNQINS